MPSIELLIAFFLASSVFAATPGPGMLYAAAQTVAGGRRAGVFAAVGMAVGGYVHVLAATFGLALIFAAIPALYVALKIVGALYLIWLGARLFWMARPMAPIEPATIERIPRRAFWQSVTVEALNPKTALFFVAFLPQFTDPGAVFPIWLQLLVLGTFANFYFFCADVVCVAVADRITAFFRTSHAAGRMLKRVSGSILIGLGLHVALIQR